MREETAGYADFHINFKYPVKRFKDRATLHNLKLLREAIDEAMVTSESILLYSFGCDEASS